MKSCSDCRQVLSLDAFGSRRAAIDGKQARCKACRNKADRERYQAAPSHRREQNRVWRASNPDVAAASMRASRLRWAAANPDKMEESRKRWRKANPELVLAKEQRRRARKKGAAVVEKITTTELFSRDGGLCHICKKRVRRSEASIDHLVALSLGGDHSWTNVALAHISCNVQRGVDRIPAQLRLVG